MTIPTVSESGSRRVAVVTGASSGIGEALARRLARRGWRCVLLARREERLAELAREVGGEYEVCDVSDREAVERAGAAILERHATVHLLVNNAGIPGRGGFLTLDAQHIEQLVATNYLGGVWCLRALLPALERGRPAHVVNVASVAGVVAFPPSGPYCAAKHAQVAFSRAIGAELRARGILVHTVNPGFVHTEGFPNRDRFPEPLRRLVIGPDEVADHVLDGIDRGRIESFVPWWYRPAGIVQAAAPALLVRILGRRYGLRSGP